MYKRQALPRWGRTDSPIIPAIICAKGMKGLTSIPSSRAQSAQSISWVLCPFTVWVTCTVAGFFLHLSHIAIGFPSLYAMGNQRGHHLPEQRGPDPVLVLQLSLIHI